VQDRRRLLGETPAKRDALRGLLPAFGDADRSIVFTQTIAGAEAAAAELAGCGLEAQSIHSALDPSARRAVLSRFGKGMLQVVTAPQVLDEGIDVPAADLAVILAASRSRRQMVQRMGRVLRPKPDGGTARFVVVFVESTVEDPAEGAHEGFLEEVTDVADEVRRLSFRLAPGQRCETSTSLLVRPSGDSSDVP
jgi:superfamily II DNA or RNA helicase